MYFKKEYIKFLFTVVLLFFFTLFPVRAQQGSIEISVDRNNPGLNETFTLTATIRGGPEVLIIDDISSYLADFHVIRRFDSTNFSFINGNVEMVQTLEYVLQPLKSGNFVIGPVELVAGLEKIKSNSIEITVAEGAVKPNVSPSTPPLPTPQSYNPPQSVHGRDMWVIQEVDKRAPYVNEQVTLTFKFYYRNPVYDSSTYHSPEPTGFNIVNLSQSTVPSVEKVKGEEYYVEEIKTALFPVASGEKVINPALLSVPVDFFDYKTLESNDVKVNIKPLPEEGKPEGFSGAVGEFIVYVKTDKEEGEVNQPVSLEITIEGWGNVDNIGEPILPDFPDFKFYSSGNSKENSVEGDLVYAKKKFKYVLIPTKSGNLEIPEIGYSYFNPYRKKYEVIKTKPLKISVVPGRDNSSLPVNGNGQEDIKIVNQDINHIKKDVFFAGKGEPFLYRNGMLRVGIFMPPLLLIICLFIKKYSDRLNSDIGFARLKRSYGKARKNLNKAKKIMKEEKETDFYSLISRILTDYVGDRFNLPSAGLTLEEIEKILEEKQVERDLIDLFRKCYERCDYARFAPGNSTEEKMKETFSMADKLLSSLERKNLK